MGRDLASHEYSRRDPDYKAPIHVDKTFVNADLHIATVSSSRISWPGIRAAGKRSSPPASARSNRQGLHGPAPMSHERAVECNLDGNPVHAEHPCRESGPRGFHTDVTLNERRQITGVFAGGLEEAHREGVAFMARQCRSEVDAPVDAVITSAAGFPPSTSPSTRRSRA